jgi:uncharacterized integral membrane protein
MARKLMIWLVLLPLAIVILMFAVANRQSVTVSFDPFNAVQPAASLTLPLFVLIFILVLLGVFIGGIAAWIRQSRYRRVARVLEGDVAGLRREVSLLNERLVSVPPQDAASDDAARLPYHLPRN